MRGRGGVFREVEGGCGMRGGGEVEGCLMWRRWVCVGGEGVDSFVVVDEVFVEGGDELREVFEECERRGWLSGGGKFGWVWDDEDGGLVDGISGVRDGFVVGGGMSVLEVWKVRVVGVEVLWVE